jgi:mannosyltransferase OCH1-like enzyme
MSCGVACSTFDVSGVELYSSLQTAVERSDLWRYSVMCKHGGVYTDADTICVRPIQVGVLCQCFLGILQCKAKLEPI